MLTGYRYADDGTERTSYLLVETLPPGSKQVANVLTHFLNSTSMGGIPITSGFSTFIRFILEAEDETLE